MIAEVRQRAQQLLQENATTILTAGGVVGTVATAILAGRAGLKAGQIIEQMEVDRAVERKAHGDTDANAPMTRKEKLIIAGPYFVPPVFTGAATIGSIILANKMSAQKAAALAAAYGLSQKQLEEYKGKVAEKLGVQKTQKLQDELAQDRVSNTPGSSKIVIIEGGDVLCFDQPTGRYFKSSMEKINRAVNAANREIINHDHVSASFFYDELELPPTTWTDDVGWNSDNMLELEISTTLTEDEKPCIAIDFKRLPTANYQRNMY